MVSKKERNSLIRHLLGVYMGLFLSYGGSNWLPRPLGPFEIPITAVGTVLIWYCGIQLSRDYFRRRALRKQSETSERGREA